MFKYPGRVAQSVARLAHSFFFFFFFFFLKYVLMEKVYRYFVDYIKL